MAHTTRWQLNRDQLLADFVAACEARGVSQRAACAELGLQANIPQKLKQDGYAPDADALLTLLLWLRKGHPAHRYATLRPAPAAAGQ